MALPVAIAIFKGSELLWLMAVSTAGAIYAMQRRPLLSSAADPAAQPLAVSALLPVDFPLPEKITVSGYREWVRRNKTEDYCPVPETLGFNQEHNCGDAAVALDNVWTFRTTDLHGQLGSCPMTGRSLEELEALYGRKFEPLPIPTLRTLRRPPGTTAILLYNPMGGPVRHGSYNHYVNVCFDKDAKPVFVDCSGGLCRHVDLSAEETQWGRLDPWRGAEALILWTWP